MLSYFHNFIQLTNRNAIIQFWKQIWIPRAVYIWSILSHFKLFSQTVSKIFVHISIFSICPYVMLRYYYFCYNLDSERIKEVRGFTTMFLFLNFFFFLIIGNNFLTRKLNLIVTCVPIDITAEHLIKLVITRGHLLNC